MVPALDIGVPHEHGGRVCREVGIARGEEPFVLGRQRFPGVEKLLFPPGLFTCSSYSHLGQNCRTTPRW